MHLKDENIVKFLSEQNTALFNQKLPRSTQILKLISPKYASIPTLVTRWSLEINRKLINFF